jgi:hypothetical protein
MSSRSVSERSTSPRPFPSLCSRPVPSAPEILGPTLLARVADDVRLTDRPGARTGADQAIHQADEAVRGDGAIVLPPGLRDVVRSLADDEERGGKHVRYRGFVSCLP